MVHRHTPSDAIAVVVNVAAKAAAAGAGAAAPVAWITLKDAAEIANPEIAPHLFAKGRLLPDGRGIVTRPVVVVGC